MDPAGPIPYRFEPDELSALASGLVPGTGDSLFAAVERRSRIECITHAFEQGARKLPAAEFRAANSTRARRLA